MRSIAWGFRLSTADAEDVAQAVWVKLYERIGELREPLALPGWISVVAANECRRVIKSQRRMQPMDREWEDWHGIPSGPYPSCATQEGPEIDALRDEGVRVVRDGLAELAPRHRELLLLLAADPPVPYAEIGARMGMPVGSIGPTRARALRKLRETRAVRSWIQPGLGLAA